MKTKQKDEKAGVEGRKKGKSPPRGGTSRTVWSRGMGYVRATAQGREAVSGGTGSIGAGGAGGGRHQRDGIRLGEAVPGKG